LVCTHTRQWIARFHTARLAADVETHQAITASAIAPTT
jgi:hypothetical protein